MKDKELKEQIALLQKHIHDLQNDLIHDSLTGLKTRNFFEQNISTYLSTIPNVGTDKRRKLFSFKNLSFLFLDIDHFKNINDTYGHSAGDEVLRDISKVIAKNVREGDTVARWGGEEIVASLLGANESEAKEKAENIRREIEKITFHSIPDLKVTVSIGVSSNFEGSTYRDLLKNADLALYKAKKTGRNKVVAFSELEEHVRTLT